MTATAPEQIWSFGPTGWQRIPQPWTWPTDPDADFDLHACLNAAGYDMEARYGSDTASLHLELWSWQESDEHLLILTTFGRWHAIHVSDLPSVLHLLAEWLPLVESAARLDRAGLREERRVRRRRKQCVRV